jgi:exodeoxyribonuclease VII large subunit
MSRPPGTVVTDMQQEPTYTVAEIAADIGRVIDRAFPAEVWVQGEIRDLNRAPSGHVYFSLVDPADDPTVVSQARLPVTLFAADKVAINRMLQRSGAGRFDDGIAVRIRGRLSHYPARGSVQLRMVWIDTEFTLGKLAAERHRVLEALAADGLLERNAALPFPAVPLRIGLVTSAGSAAHADFMEEVAASGFRFDVTVVDTRVQGADAEESLIEAIAAAAPRNGIVALVRGGGSRTDLAAFDRETVARAVAACPVPVVTGIGHEIDETVVDRVAARSYRTPTACAAGLVGEVARYLRRLETASGAIAAAAGRTLVRVDRELVFAAGRITHSTRRRLRFASGEVASASGRVTLGARRSLHRADAAAVARGRRVVGAAAPAVDRAGIEVAAARARLRAAGVALDRAQGRLRTVAATVEGRDPARVLARGWTLTVDEAGRIVRNAQSLVPGDTLTTVFAKGRATSTVISTDWGRDASNEQEL